MSRHFAALIGIMFLLSVLGQNIVVPSESLSETLYGGTNSSFSDIHFLSSMPKMTVLGSAQSMRNTTTEAKPLFAFVYHKIGGFAPIEETITYDSFTKELRATGENVSSKVLSKEQEQNLTQAFLDNKFFELRNNFYPPECCDVVQYTLIATIGSKVNAVSWSSISVEAPKELFNIVEDIEYQSFH